jgi:hypothetical protein
MPESQRRPEPLHLALGPRVLAPPAWGALLLQTLVVACAVAVAVAPWASVSLRAVAAVALVSVAGVLHQLSSRREHSAKARAWLVVDDRGVHRVEGGAPPVTLVDWREPLGATVLSSADRARFLIALTTERTTRLVSARIADGEDAACAPTLIERATTTPDSDLRADDESALAAADAERLLGVLARRAPFSLDRVYLSDAGGEALVLDRTELRVGVRRFDLSVPLEWRALLFQEVGAHAATVCQATWVRQGDIEVVLVAPMAADGTWMRDAGDAVRAAGEAGTVERSIALDVRLMQASVCEPPPRELRRAIDRLFMLPLRRALDRAPRVSRVPPSPSQTRTEGRA